jgi:hypothetical protein
LSKLELPIRAFVLDYCQRAFPKVDFGRGSAANDLIVKAFAAILQPIRHEIDVLKINQSLANWRYMRPEDLDQIAANWGRYRQNGGQSQGNVRLYFDKAIEYQFSQLEFYTADNLTFNLIAPVTITAADLFQRRMTSSSSDNRFFFDVTVRSAGLGSRFALPAGSITGVRNRPPGLVAVEQQDDFIVTAPEESNFDLVNAMFKNIGMRNLVSRSSIRAPLLDNFPGIIDLFIAGAGHNSMVRDLVNVQLQTGPVQLHAGGMTDVWLNTATLARKQITFSYVPSSRRIKLVSAAQSQEQELIFDFQRGIVTLDGYFQNPEVGAYAVDESISLTFDLQDVPLKTFIISMIDDYRNSIAVKDIIAGNEMMVMPGAAGYGNLNADIIGLNFRNADIVVGDSLLVDGKHRRITRMDGRVFETSPATVTVGDYLYLGSPLTPSSRTIAITGIETHARVNDRLIVASSAAAGMYSVIAVASNLLTIGRVDASVTVATNIVNPDDSSQRLITLTGPGGTQPLHNLDLTTASFLYFGTDGGFDQAKYFKIVAAVPGLVTTAVTISDPGGLTPGLGTDAEIIAGLVGSMPTDTPIILERDDNAYGAQASKFPVVTTHTLYANELPVTIAAGTDTIENLGIGVRAAVGDVVIFFDLTVPNNAIPASGADGSRFSLVVSKILSPDKIRVQPSIPFDLPQGARYAVMTNSQVLATAAVDAVDSVNNDITFNSFPLGLGDGLGLIIKKGLQQYVVINSTAGATRTLKFKPPSYVRTLTFSAPGYVAPTEAAKGLNVKDVAGGFSGILYSFDNITRTWLVIPATPADVFSGLGNTITVEGTNATGVQAVTSTGPTPVGYTDPVVGDLGSFVRQGSATGLLSGYNSSLFEWYVKPLSASDTFDDLTLLTYVDLGGGAPTLGHGQGTLASIPASAGIAAGPVTLTLDKPISFSAMDTVSFYSRFGSSGCNFDDQNLIVDPNPAYTPGSMFTSVVPGTDQVALLAGVDLGLLDVDKLDTTSLRLTTSTAADVVRFANAPPAALFTLATPIAQNETIIGQTDIGRWAAPGRCLLITGPGGTRLVPILAPLSANSIQLATGMPITIYAGQGYTWEIVEALHLPYWIVAPAQVRQYRVFRTPTVGDLMHQATSGLVNQAQPTYFTDVNGGLQALLVAKDLAASDIDLYIDSGAYAATVPFSVKSVIAGDTIELVGADFTASGASISYRIMKRNGSKTMENWMDGYIAPASSHDEILLSVDPGNVLRNHTLEQWNVIVAPSATWDGTGAPGQVNFTMPTLKALSVTPSTTSLALVSRRVGTADNVAITTTSSALTVVGFANGTSTTRAYASIAFTGNPVSTETVTIGMSGISWVFQFVPPAGVPVPGRVGVVIGTDSAATCSNLLAAIQALSYPADVFKPTVVVIDKTTAHYSAIQSTDAFNSSGFTLPHGTPVRLTLRNNDRVDAASLTGMAQNTFNYYSNDFMELPVVKIIAVEALDSSTLEPVKAVDFSLGVDDTGLRYSANERNTLVINDATVVYKPLRLTYVSDPTIGQVNAFINDEDTRILNSNQLAKRMETIAVSIQVGVRTSLASNEVGSLLANFVNTRRSTLQLSKADIIKALYDNREISYIDIQTLRLDGVFYDFYGNTTNYRDVSEVFGSDTSCYLAENIFVTKI